jgi:hypothetical protein
VAIGQGKLSRTNPAGQPSPETSITSQEFQTQGVSLQRWAIKDNGYMIVRKKSKLSHSRTLLSAFCS